MNLPPTTFHSSETAIPLRGLLPASFVKRSRGKLGSGGLHKEKQASCLKRRARMCRSCFCEQMFAGWVCLLNALTAGTSFMNYFVLRSEVAERGHWKDWLWQQKKNLKVDLWSQCGLSSGLIFSCIIRMYHKANWPSFKNPGLNNT